MFPNISILFKCSFQHKILNIIIAPIILGNNLDSGNGTLRVKSGNNGALRGLYSGWLGEHRSGAKLSKFQEEIECEELSAEFVRRLSWHQPEKCNPRLQELFGNYRFSRYVC